MKLCATLLTFVFAGCAGIPQEPRPVSVEAAPSLPSVESIPEGHFAILGVVNPGVYPVKENETIIDAIRAAGGPAMCEVCFKSGGKARLWELIADPTIIRNGQKFKFSRKALASILIAQGDFIMIDHIPF